MMFYMCLWISLMVVESSFGTYEEELPVRELPTLTSSPEKCLDIHQYRITHKLASTPVCIRMLDTFQHQKHKMEGVPKEVGPFYKLKSMLDSSEHTEEVCDVIRNSMLPCLNEVEGLLRNILHDEENCGSVRQMLGKQFNEDTMWAMANGFYNSVCAKTSRISNKRCGQSISEQLIDDDGNVEKSIRKNLKNLFLCKRQVGRCCADHLNGVVEIALQFNYRFLGKWSNVVEYFDLVALRPLQEMLDHCGATKKKDQLPHFFSVFQKDCPAYNHIRKPIPVLPSDLQVSEPLSPLNDDNIHPDYPQQVRIAVAGKDLTNGRSNGMVISWTTKTGSAGIVQFGINRNSLSNSIAGSSSSYTAQLNGAVDRFIIPTTYQHNAALTNLQPSTVYFYRVVSKTHSSSIYSFTTSGDPMGLHDDKTYKFGIFGDLGLYEGKDTLNVLMSNKKDVDLHFHVGDLGYADNWMTHNAVTFGYEAVWNAFQRAIEPLAASAPYMVLPGNHEVECHSPLVCLKHKILDNTLGNFTAYNHRFKMPSKSSQGAQNMWYSFNYGPVHFVAISTETDFNGAPDNVIGNTTAGDFGDQLAWLKNDLAQANTVEQRKIRPWVIVLGHRPVYVSGFGNEAEGLPLGVSAKLMAWLEPEFEKHNVDLYFSGHKHRYERQTPIFRGKPYVPAEGTPSDYKNAQHTTYIVHGAGGNEEMHNLLEDTHPLPSWVAYTNDQNFGVGYLSVSKMSLTWEFKTKDNAVLDTLTIRK